MLTTVGQVDPNGIRAAEDLLSDNVCRAIEYRQQAESTNTLAIDDLRMSKTEADQCPKLYFTDNQTAGRGRHGRTWFSTDGTLTFSLVLMRSGMMDRAAKLLSLAVGVGVARCIEFDFAPLQVKLKWPNDVHIGGGKVAGILLETHPSQSRSVIVGVGVNVSNLPDADLAVARSSSIDSGADHSNRAQCLSRLVGRQVHRYGVLRPLVTSIVNTMNELEDAPDLLVDEFRARCLLTGQRISYQHGGMPREGNCRGVTGDGHLIVEAADGVVHVSSGEALLVRPTILDDPSH